MKKLCLIFLLLIMLITCFSVKAEKLSLNAKSAILIDAASGNILYSNNEHEKLPMASMTKIMSLLLIMEAIDKGTIKYSDTVVVSEHAASMGGSQVYLNPLEKYKVSELIKSVAMASANDAIVALAERTYGSEEHFVEKMNEKAKELGLKDTHFMNPHGLDKDDHYSSSYDMAVMARELLKHEDILKFTSVYEEYLEKNDGSKIWLVNTNKLVRYYEGVDGLKTGFTNNAGYCITATAKKNNFRLISVVMGESSIENRTQDIIKMLNYGFNTYKINLIKSKNEVLGNIAVTHGKEKSVGVRLISDATELLNNEDEISKYDFKINIKKIKAPVKVGDVVGNVTIYDEEKNIVTTSDITVVKDVLKANLWDFFKRNLANIVSFN